MIFSFNSHATQIELIRLQDSYPEQIQSVSGNSIVWKDGTHFDVVDTNSFFGNLFSGLSFKNKKENSISIKDLQCDSYESIFKKIYGDSPSAVSKHLVTVYWMPNVFGKRYPLKLTSINGIDKKIQRISAQLEKLPPSYFKYLKDVGGSYYWRNVKYENYLSAHSFGIAMDISTHYGNYWLWDLKKAKHKSFTLTLINSIPKEIIDIFEQEGFLWGGRWAYYDTMHFEYRPEMFVRNAASRLEYNNQLGLRCVT